MTTKSGFLSSLFDRLVAPAEPVDPWSKRAATVHPSRFSAGCRKPWPWYFDGISNVHVRRVEDICRWLRRCKYAYDKLLFLEDDFWQHPVTFETMRKGDCEDHALWAWRKFADLGLYAELVVGVSENADPRAHGHHAWVIFERKSGKRYVMETTAKRGKKHMIMTVNEARRRYTPQVSVDTEFQTWVYGR